MRRPTGRQLVWILIGVAVVGAVIWGFLPGRVEVRTVPVVRGPLRVVVEEEGETRVVDRYAILAPIAAHMRRIVWEPGDRVGPGDVLVELEAPRPTLLDPRTREELLARAQAARAQVRQAEAAASIAAVERGRMERLAAGGAATPQARDQAQADHAQAQAALAAARSELRAAQAALGEARPERQPVQEVLRAPVGGEILSVQRQSAGPVNPGDLLIEIGAIADLELQVDVLSDDAVRIERGTPVEVDRWGGAEPLSAVVTRVEPEGYTAISALGVEEQRVPVIARLVSPPELWQSRLGTGYRVLARFVVWQGVEVLQIPTSALFRTEEGWAVFVVERRRAVLRTVTVGQEAGLAVEIVHGLAEGEEVIVHPDNEVEDGVRVRAQRDDPPPGEVERVEPTASRPTAPPAASASGRT